MVVSSDDLQFEFVQQEFFARDTVPLISPAVLLHS